jgi:hypothetical protein
MIIEGVERTRIIREMPPEIAGAVANDNHGDQVAGLARRVRVLSSAGLSIHRIAVKLGISKSVVARTLAWVRS